jgi:DeoR/GlpR family transcriptional regulator of sugar metabolism
MKPKDRQEEILYLLRSLQREWYVKDLSKKFNVTELTIRRDLNTLYNKNEIIRTHGGCLTTDNGSFNTNYYKQFERNVDVKTLIGREAAKFIKPNDTILVGDGSTAFQFAAHLKNTDPFTVYTNSIAAIQELKKCSNIRVYVLGGEYDHDLNMLFLKGSLSDRILETLHFNIVIMGIASINSRGDCLSENEEVARTNQIILRRGDRKILLADHSKVGATTGNVIFGNISDFDLWITSHGIKKSLMNKLKSLTEIIKIDTQTNKLPNSFINN